MVRLRPMPDGRCWNSRFDRLAWGAASSWYSVSASSLRLTAEHGQLGLMPIAEYAAFAQIPVLRVVGREYL